MAEGNLNISIMVTGVERLIRASRKLTVVMDRRLKSIGEFDMRLRIIEQHAPCQRRFAGPRGRMRYLKSIQGSQV